MTSKQSPHYTLTQLQGGGTIKAWTQGVPVDPEAQKQLHLTAKLPFIFKWLAVMPDVHVGLGSTIGSVIPTTKAIIPAAVGVDIGCGMMAQKTSLTASDLPNNLTPLRAHLEKTVPHGRTDQGGTNDKGAWQNPPESLFPIWKPLETRLKSIKEKHPKLHSTRARSALFHLGTLGSGNHFIELCLDEQQHVWVLLHSGSRGIGARLGKYFMTLAQEEMLVHKIVLKDKYLSYLREGTRSFEDYVEAVDWAQEFARINRVVMMNHIIAGLKAFFPPFSLSTQAINCHHNYVQKETHFGKSVWITRKGALSARKNQLGIIPGSMGTHSYIVEGLGNDMSFHSSSHGAGRLYSRRKAKALFSVADHQRSTQGVECRKDSGVLDETPKAYKNIDNVIKAQSDLISVRFKLKQFLCIKG